MEFLKKNLFLTTLITTVLIATIILGILIKNLLGNVRTYEDDVKLIIESEKEFANSDYALSQENVNLAKANYQITEESFKKLISNLNEKFPVPDANEKMTALKFKNFLRQVCIRMENLLRSGDIWMPEALKYFTYDTYMQANVLPDSTEIKQVLKQLEIIQEIIYLVSQSQIDKLLELRRLNNIEFVKRDLYDYMEFRLILSGNIMSIQQFINSLHEAKYFLMVNGLNLKADPIPQKSRSGITSEKPSADRSVYANEASVKAEILLNYLIFHDKE